MNRTQVWSTAVLCTLLSTGLATVYVAWQHGFGSGDLTAMLVWSIPLGVLTARLFAAVLGRLKGMTLIRRAILLALAGVVTAVGWTIGLAVLLGGWLRAFSFPVGPIWVVSCALSGVFAASVPAGTSDNENSGPS